MTAIADLLARCAEIPVRVRNTGIYFLLLDGEIVYVGQSKDVDLRVGQHIGQRDVPLVNQARGIVPNSACKRFDRAIWFPVAEADLDAYESALIRALAPRQNFRASSDDSRDAEILSALGLQIDDVARARFEEQRREKYSVPHLTINKRRDQVQKRDLTQKGRARRFFAGLVAIMQERAA